MNVFRLAGDMTHLMSVILLLLKIHTIKSCAACWSSWSNYPMELSLGHDYSEGWPALACGCTVVVKPSEFTPLTALAAAELALQAGIPPGVLNMVMGNAPEIGDALMESTQVRKITFTSSTAVGKKLMAGSANTVKKVLMLRSLEYVACYYITGSYKIEDYEFCTRATHFRDLSYAVSFLPYYWRAMQCARRWFDEGDTSHLINLGKYVSAMLAAGTKVAYEKEKNVGWLTCCHCVELSNCVPIVLGLCERLGITSDQF